MDTKINIKEEESLSDDVASQNGTEFFQEVVTMKREHDAVLLDDDCDIVIKPEIKAETSFPKHPIKTETVTSSCNWEMDRKTIFEEQTLVSDFGSQREGEFLSEDPVIKDKKHSSDYEMGKRLEIKEEPWWLERETQPLCDDIKDEEFPPVKSSSLCAGVNGAASGKSPSFYNEKDHLQYEHQRSDVTEMPTAEEHILSEHSGECSGGEEMYTKPLHLKQKNLLHKSKTPYTCEICDKSFTLLSNLKRHYLIHEGKKSHQCKTCGKSFTQLSYLKAHNSLIHAGKKPHQCKTCNKSFTWLSHLKAHNLFHEGKKPHQCKICNRSFTQSSDLNIHNLIHEGKKPHQCKTCDRSFTQLSHLKTHNLIHEGKKPHQCKTCDKRFTRLSHLKTHYLIHEGKKPHQCKTCDNSFTRLSHLKRHCLIHEGKKPHQCKTCNKSFARLSHLKRHYLVHESKK